MNEWGDIMRPSLPGPRTSASLPYPLSAPQALEKLQFLYLADNLLGSIPGPLPLSLRLLHLQVSHTPRARTLTGARDTEVR